MTWYPILTPKTYYLTPVTVANAGGGWEGVGEHMIRTPVATCGPWSVEEVLVLFFTTDMGLWGSGRFLRDLCGKRVEGGARVCPRTADARRSRMSSGRLAIRALFEF